MKKGFFFQGNSILLPPGTPKSENDNEIDIDFCKKFIKSAHSPPGDPCGGTLCAVSPYEVPTLDGTPVINVINIPVQAELPPGWHAEPVRQRLPLLSIGMTEGKGQAGRLLRAFHIAQWRSESLFCGSCGAKNTDAPEEYARLCPACGRLEFPRIAPAIIVIITDDKDRVLLAHNKKFTANIYSLIAGFNEAGESLESTVCREIREEVNIEVKDIKYIVSQPWPFPHSLMLGFSARYAGGEIRADGIEIDDAQWWCRDALPQLPGQASVSRYLIDRWLEGTV